MVGSIEYGICGPPPPARIADHGSRHSLVAPEGLPGITCKALEWVPSSPESSSSAVPVCPAQASVAPAPTTRPRRAALLPNALLNVAGGRWASGYRLTCLYSMVSPLLGIALARAGDNVVIFAHTYGSKAIDSSAPSRRRLSRTLVIRTMMEAVVGG